MAAPGVEAHSTPHGRNQLGAESLLRAHLVVIRREGDDVQLLFSWSWP